MPETFKKYIDVIINDIVIKLMAMFFVFFKLIICTILVLYITVPEPIFQELLNTTEFNKPDIYILVSWICIAFTTLTLSLWVFHEIGILKFRGDWTSKAIYGVAISAILGTTVSIYSNAIVDQNIKPLEGKWYIEYNFTHSYINKDEWEIKSDRGYRNHHSSALVSWSPENKSYELVSYGGEVQFYIPRIELNDSSLEVLIYFPVLRQTGARGMLRSQSEDKETKFTFNNASTGMSSAKYEFEVVETIDTTSTNITLQRDRFCRPFDDNERVYTSRDDLICKLILSRTPFK